MKLIAGMLLVVMASVAQVTVAPLFPLRGAVVEFGLLTVVLLALTAGPRAAMLAVPFCALAVGFAGDRSPGLLILAYLPVLPLGVMLEEARVPFPRYMQLCGLVVLCGVWARSLLAGAAIVQGADFAFAPFVRELWAPGMVLDILAFTAMYLPIRMIGRGADTFTLRQGRYAI
ncbi:MAG: hypothetical protein WD557_17035 [Dehalococcoidia bacterium]